MLASELLAAVRLRAMLPSAVTAPGTADADLLSYANQEISSNLVSLVMSVTEEFFVATTDVALTAGQAIYRVPSRAIGGKLREVWMLYGNSLLHLPRIEPEQLTKFVTNSSGIPAAFVMEAGGIRLVPTPSNTGLVIRMRYFVAPGQLTTTATKFGSVDAFAQYGGSPNDMTMQMGAVGGAGSLTSFNPNVLYDVICGNTPNEYLALDCDSPASNRLHCSAGFANMRFADSEDGFIGCDYVAVRGYSPLVQLPAELIPLLIARVTHRVHMALGQLEKADRAEREIAKLEARALQLLSPRVDGSPKKVFGLLNSSNRGPFGFTY